MRKIKIAAGLAHVDYGNIADLVKQVTVAGADYIHSDAADMHDLKNMQLMGCLLYTSPSPRDRQKSRMPSSA